MNRTRTDDASIEQRLREIINPAFEEWLIQKIDSTELERRRELAQKQVIAEFSGGSTAGADATAAAVHVDPEASTKLAEARRAAIVPRHRMCRVQKRASPLARPLSHSRALCLHLSAPHQAGRRKGWDLLKHPSESSSHLAANSLSTWHSWFIKWW